MILGQLLIRFHTNNIHRLLSRSIAYHHSAIHSVTLQTHSYSLNTITLNIVPSRYDSLCSLMPQYDSSYTFTFLILPSHFYPICSFQSQLHSLTTFTSPGQIFFPYHTKVLNTVLNLKVFSFDACFIGYQFIFVDYFSGCEFPFKKDDLASNHKTTIKEYKK